MKRMNEKIYAVAVDGPSGAGKSTLARAAAERLGILYVDTGAIYRTIGVYVYRHHIDPKDAAAVAAVLPEITISLRYDEVGLQRMYLNGEDVTKEIRLPAMSMYASDVSAIPAVRDYLMELQRSLAREHSVIMDGQGHRHGGAARRGRENFPLRRRGGAGKAPGAGAAAAGYAQALRRGAAGDGGAGLQRHPPRRRAAAGGGRRPSWWTPAPWISTPASSCCWT